MKILIVAWMNPTSTDMPLFHVTQWRQMGHQVEVFPFDLEVTDEPRFRFLNSVEGCELEVGERRIARACKKHRPDILLLFYHFIRVRRMERLRRKCGCKVGFYLDNNHLLWRDTAQLMSAADFLTVHDRYVVPLVKGDRAGRNSNVYYVRGAAEPSEHRPIDLDDWDKLRYGCEIAFIGGTGPDRLQALPLLVKHKLKIWGSLKDWSLCPVLLPFVSAEPVYGLKKTKIYNAASIIINLEESEKQIDAINPRICEALASGGFVLTNYTGALEDVGFRDDESIAWFKSYEEMACKAAYYLANPDARRRVAQKGREFVLNTLTYEKISREWMHWMESVCDPSMNNH
jgi:glycosyltransferase involved in cell wall biosynthesis